MLAKKKHRSIYDTKTMAWFICLLAATFYAYDFLLRVQPNILVKPLMQFYSTNALGIGTLYAAYYWLYTPLQIPAGLVADRYNLRVVLGVSAFLCALGAILFAEVQSYPVALMARIFMGVGSAFAFVGAMKLASRWLHQKHFAAFSGIVTTFGTVGAIATNAVLPVWVTDFGWQQTVLLTGYIGLVITLLLVIVIRSKPRGQKAPSQEFRTWGHAFHRLLLIIKQWEFWLNGIVGSLMFLPVTVLAGLWGTSFLEKAYDMTPHHAAIADAIIFIGMAVGGPIAGWVSDYIKRRKMPMYIGTLLAALLLLAFIYEHNLSNITIYCILFFIGFFSGPQVLVFAIAKEISPLRATGTASACTNFLVSMGAFVFAPLVGHIMVTLWDGQLTSLGTPIYSLKTMREALLTLPLMSILVFFILLFIPETFTKMKFKRYRGRPSQTSRKRR